MNYNLYMKHTLNKKLSELHQKKQNLKMSALTKYDQKRLKPIEIVFAACPQQNALKQSWKLKFKNISVIFTYQKCEYQKSSNRLSVSQRIHLLAASSFFTASMCAFHICQRENKFVCWNKKSIIFSTFRKQDTLSFSTVKEKNKKTQAKMIYGTHVRGGCPHLFPVEAQTKNPKFIFMFHITRSWSNDYFE